MPAESRCQWLESSQVQQILTEYIRALPQQVTPRGWCYETHICHAMQSFSVALLEYQ